MGRESLLPVVFRTRLGRSWLGPLNQSRTTRRTARRTTDDRQPSGGGVNGYGLTPYKPLHPNRTPFTRQADLPLVYDGISLDCGYRAAVIVNNRVILELKSIEHILPLHEAQLLIYLRLSQCPVGLLLDFNTVSLKDGIRRRVL